MLLENIQEDIIYHVVIFLNGCIISRLRSTSNIFNVLIKKQENNIWSTFLNKKVIVWKDCYDLPIQVLKDFKLKTRNIFKEKELNSNYIKYAFHYYCSKFIIINLRKELINNFKLINTVFYYGPDMLNNLLKLVYDITTPIIDIKKAKVSFQKLINKLMKKVNLCDINIIQTIQEIDEFLYLTAKYMYLIIKNSIVSKYIFTYILKKPKLLNTSKRISRRLIYLSKLCNICFHRLNISYKF
jgi:hypothetical protein|tara:strand:+ start:18828 stop:19550 length:723 start_codon:yes stop_codon:yes gene_type:complete